MRYREDFTLYPRKTQGGAVVWYYRTYDEQGLRTAGRSTRQTSKTRARNHCNRLFREGKLIPAPNTLFSEYAKEWWIWGKCAYIRGRLEHSDPKKPAISQRYAADQRRILENHLLPRFGKLRLASISAGMIEAWSFQLRERGLTGKGANNILGCLRVMLREAFRLGHIGANPFERVQLLGVNDRERGVLTIGEVQKLFAEENIAPAWGGHLLFRCINLTAAATACRQGELLALRDDDVHPGWLHIAHSWSSSFGLGPTKTKEVRDVPIPTRVLEALRPFLGGGGFIFSLNGGKTPVHRIGVNESLYAALAAIGISKEERIERNIVFHGWRRWMNTVLRARSVPDPLVRRVTGHLDPAMTEHYSTFVREDFAPVLAIQEEVLG